MGSPVSPIVANLYMEDFEVEAIRIAPNPRQCGLDTWMILWRPRRQSAASVRPWATLAELSRGWLGRADWLTPQRNGLRL